MKHLFPYLIILILINSAACEKGKISTSKTISSRNKLVILTLDRIKTSGFLTKIVPAFEQEKKCKVDIVSCGGTSDLLDILRNDSENKKFDLVIGLDNCVAVNPQEYTMLAESTALKKHSVNNSYVFDPKHKLIPYAYGYLALIYNELKVSEPPESFGELQDARFLNQTVICNPRTSGLGRAVLLWSVALFGNEGYQQFWKSIKKNVHSSKDTWQEAIQTLELQDCGMAFGFSSTPAWIMETRTNPIQVKASVMKEGSFLYIEAASVLRKAKHKALAEAFLEFLLTPEAQKYVTYNLGMFPTNESAPLPNHFTSIPFTTYSVNDKLIQENPAANLNTWLDFWDRLFTGNLM